MNFKKRFEKRIEEDKKSMYSESDRAFLATLQDMVVECPDGEVIAKHVNYKKPLMIAVACFLAVALALTLILYFTLPHKSGDKLYLDSNFADAESDINELNSDLALFAFEVYETKYSIDIKRIYDSVSGDTLYYRLAINNATQDFNLNTELHIVVNKNYIHDDITYLYDDIIEKPISGYRLIYTQTVTPSAIPGINTVDCMGEMKIGYQWVYIMKYHELSLGEGAFVENIQSMIHIK